MGKRFVFTSKRLPYRGTVFFLFERKKREGCFGDSVSFFLKKLNSFNQK